MASSPLARATSETRLSLSHITAQNETNLLGTVHGGVIMTHVDSVAGVVAARHSGGPAVTASMDEMVFLVPVRVGDVVHFSAQVNWTGRSSMEVGVRITADRWDAVGPQVHVASAYLVFVAVDEDGKPREVPQVVPVTDEDHRRLREAEIRRSHRLARRAAIIASRQDQSRDDQSAEGQPRVERSGGGQSREGQSRRDESRDDRSGEGQPAEGQSRTERSGEGQLGGVQPWEGHAREGQPRGKQSRELGRSAEVQSREGQSDGESGGDRRSREVHSREGRSDDGRSFEGVSGDGQSGDGQSGDGRQGDGGEGW